MAFVRRNRNTQNNKEEELQQPGAPVQIASGPATAPTVGDPAKNVVPQTTTAAGAPQQQVGTRSGYFTNLQKYIQGNREGAEKLGEQIASRIGTERQEAETAYDTLNKQFQTEYAAGMPKWDTNVVNRVINDPAGALKDEETMKQFEKIRSGKFTGPAGLAETTGYEDALKEMQDITNFSQLAQTSGGRRELIRQIPGYNLASSGGLSLDQLLLQNVKPALQKVTSEAEAGLPLKEQFEKKTEETSLWAKPAQEIAAKNRERLEKELLGATETLEQQIQSSVKSKIEEEKKREQRIRDLLTATAPKVKVPEAKKEEVAPQPEVGTTSPGSWNQVASGVWQNTVTGEMKYGQSPPSTQQPPAQQNLPNNGWTQVANGVWQHNVTREMGYGMAPPPPITPTTPTTPKIDDTYLGEPIMSDTPVRATGQALPVSDDRTRATNQGMVAPPPAGMSTADMINLYAAEPERFNENMATIEEGGTPVTQAQLDLLGLTREQWDNLSTLRNQAAEAGIAFDLQNYLTPQAPEAIYTPETVMTPEQRNKLNALRQLQGMTPIESNIPEGAKPYLFDIAGASEALQSQIGSAGATQREQELRDQLEEAQGQAAAPKKPKKPSSTESTLKGAAQGAAIGAQVGGPIGAAIGGVIGGVVGNITCFAAGTPVLLADGSEKNVEELDILDEIHLGGRVTGKGVVLSNFIYQYKGTFMDGSHVVYEDGNWLRASESKLAIKVEMPKNEYIPVYPIVCEHHLMMTNGFISGDMVLVDEAWDLTETQRIESLNNNTELNKTLDDVLEENNA